jgi:hypothetical protein
MRPGRRKQSHSTISTPNDPLTLTIGVPLVPQEGQIDGVVGTELPRNTLNKMKTMTPTISQCMVENWDMESP